MGKGIDTEFRRSGRGGFRIAKDNAHIMGLLSTALGNCQSANPFQQLGLGEDMIFDPADPTTFGKVRDKIEEIFQDFERNELAKLQARSDNLKVVPLDMDEGGKYGMLVYAVNLETDAPFQMTVVGGAQGVRVI